MPLISGSATSVYRKTTHLGKEALVHAVGELEPVGPCLCHHVSRGDDRLECLGRHAKGDRLGGAGGEVDALEPAQRALRA